MTCAVAPGPVVPCRRRVRLAVPWLLVMPLLALPVAAVASIGQVLQMPDLAHLVVEGPAGPLRVHLRLVQPDLACQPAQELDWAQHLLRPGSQVEVVDSAAEGDGHAARLVLWLWRGQRIDWTLLLLRLGAARLVHNSGLPASLLVPYRAAVREARAEARGIWGACGRGVRRYGEAGRPLRIPPAVLCAIARVESGQGNGAWPWTLNIAGAPAYFRTRPLALAAVKTLLAQHFVQFDVGLMQVNWKYHHALFASPEAALDPDANLRVAAQVLLREWRTAGSLSGAVARYHSTDPALGRAYLLQVRQALPRCAAELAAAGPVAGRRGTGGDRGSGSGNGTSTSSGGSAQHAPG